MKRALVLLLALLFFSVSSYASAEGKGNRIFLRKLKVTCGVTGFEMAKKHTTKEWKEIYESGLLNSEMEKLCPSAEDFKTNEEKYVATFFQSFSKDSGAIVGG